MQTDRLRRFVAHYGLAVLAAGVAAIFTRLLRGFGDSGISPLFFAAVLLSAWYGGLGPGLLATLLASGATAYLLSKGHPASFAAIWNHILRLIVFTVVSVLTSSLQDATKRAAEASRRAKEAAESASHAKSLFLAMVSHELRTPLSPVLMVTASLEHDPSLSPQVREDIRCIRRNVDLEIRLIEDLVDLSRIHSGKMRLRKEFIDIKEPMKRALQVCREDLQSKRLNLTTDFSAAESPVFGDPIRLQQVFWNLIRNAFKFTPDGGQVAVRIRNRNPGVVAVEVSDSGIGIDPQRLSSIFEAFEQGGHDIQIRFGGLGLGLAICQALIEAHDGKIIAKSEGKGCGAAFTIELPLASAATAEREDSPTGDLMVGVLPDANKDHT
ncbi:MAG: HAMP domain-containing sensor histidine kinase [Tepidisphaeraceae bacterium]|jgi:signal transduction histidine kinase